MRQLFLNELSTLPLAHNFDNAWLRVNRFIQTYKNRPVDIFESRVCSDTYMGSIQLTADMNLQDFILNSKGRNLGTLLLGITTRPYIKEGSTQEDDYLKAKFTILKDNNKIEVQGLAAAHLFDSVAIGFASEVFWENHVFDLTTVTDESACTIPVLCVSTPTHFSTTEFTNWRIDRTETEIVLVESSVHPDDKGIHLSDDHGKDILFALAKRLVRSPYVIEVVSSLPFHQHDRNFVRSVSCDGLIELVLTSTGPGYGLLVKTTGRNSRETKRISEILDDRYGT